MFFYKSYFLNFLFASIHWVTCDKNTYFWTKLNSYHIFGAKCTETKLKVKNHSSRPYVLLLNLLYSELNLSNMALLIVQASLETAEILRPKSSTKWMADSLIGPRVSSTTGWNIKEAGISSYFETFLAAANSAASPAVVADWWMYGVG